MYKTQEMATDSFLGRESWANERVSLQTFLLQTLVEHVEPVLAVVAVVITHGTVAIDEAEVLLEEDGVPLLGFDFDLLQLLLLGGVEQLLDQRTTDPLTTRVGGDDGDDPRGGDAGDSEELLRFARELLRLEDDTDRDRSGAHAGVELSLDDRAVPGVEDLLHGERGGVRVPDAVRGTGLENELRRSLGRGDLAERDGDAVESDFLH